MHCLRPGGVAPPPAPLTNARTRTVRREPRAYRANPRCVLLPFRTFTLPRPTPAKPRNGVAIGTPPTVVGDVSKGQWVGRGSFWEVYQAHDPHGGLHALKIANRPALAHVYEKEFRTVAALGPHAGLLVLPTLTAVVSGYPVELAEFCPYTLDRLIPAAAWGEAELCYLCQRVLLGLAHLNAAGLAHLDVKPQNIFVARDGTVKLGDFGSCLPYTDDEQPPAETFGEPRYAAPELIKGVITPQVDIFPLGLVLFEAATKLAAPTPVGARRLTRRTRPSSSPSAPTRPTPSSSR